MSKRNSPSAKGTKKAGKKGKKGSKGSDVNDAKIEALIHERDEIRTKLDILCTRIIENVNTEDFSDYKDKTKNTYPSDCPIQTLLAMIDQICQFRVAFLNLFSEVDDEIRIPITEKITQLAIEKPALFRKKLKPEQRLAFVMTERDTWKENAHILQIMYATIGALNKQNIKVSDILASHRLNLADVCLIFNSPIIHSINEAQKLRAKKDLDNELDELREKHAFFDITNSEGTREPQQSTFISRNIADTFTNYPNNSSKKQLRITAQSQNTIEVDYDQQEQQQKLQHRPQSKRSVSFADEVNILNENDVSNNDEHFDHNSKTFLTEHSHTNLSLTNSSITDVQSDAFKINDYDLSDRGSSMSSSSTSSYNYPYSSSRNQERLKPATMYRRLPSATTTQVTKMDPNLKMLIIKELSKKPPANGSRSGIIFSS
ncbi:unnamed protein product [Didymodactylos carnosus]|uniref:Uncharacterized protein n=1 Tax=Didymodactylos carnosus TaxID=1234261 RepID=A0A815QG43_9BILA|nr:unnamed protein product [Didymodactylos carnosus]CAF1462766.1 unnamed protein product [Didymodactylos carnosus]CAF4107276.1 unnamed protein product [Didymodactylos carnosus]CAF4332670.1 unnamed protein product [Didymodactylos carnosus]